MTKKYLLLDCTLRDGGYYTNWDFNKDIISEYCKSMEKLPIEYIEVGYRSIELEGYLGEYFYCPNYVLRNLKSMMPSKKLVIILNEKDIRVEHIDDLLLPCQQYITMVRIALDPNNFDRAILLARKIKSLGFEVGFNVMYMSKWKSDSSFLDGLIGLDDIIDYFYLVDSFGSVMNQDIIDTIELVKSKTNIKLGFHGHNNLEMALSNSLTALNQGCSIIDSTITGMGRGAGNLKTELLLTFLNKRDNLKVNFNYLSATVLLFEKLNIEYNWGTNLPYMFSGAYSLPQKEVMDWMGMNRYSMGAILNALNNRKNLVDDNLHLSKFEFNIESNNAVIVGGGSALKNNIYAIKLYLINNPEIIIIHTSLKYLSELNKLNNIQYCVLVGFEGEKLDEKISSINCDNISFIYPPHPRKMGTMIPVKIIEKSYELPCINFTSVSVDSPLALSIQLALNSKVENFYFAGFDGYDIEVNKHQFMLANENNNIFNDLSSQDNINMYSFTPTKYDNLIPISIYSII